MAVTLIYIIILGIFQFTLGQELCSSTGNFLGTQTCAQTNTVCFNRNGQQPNYVCQCNQRGQMGYNCQLSIDNEVLETCYGSSCTFGSFQSPGYPNMYFDRINRLYLIYVPGATEIRFSFNSPFQVEFGKDDLFVGRGLMFDTAQLDQASSSPPDKYFFEGTNTPAPFTIFSDSAWIYFKTDRSIGQAGFSINWNAVIPAPVQPLTINQGTCDDVITSSSQSSTSVMYSVQATGGTGFLTYNYSPQSGSAFNIGLTPVSVTVTDQNGARATCNFNVVVNFVAPVQPLTITQGTCDDVFTSSSQLSTSVTYSVQATGGTGFLTYNYSPQSGSAFNSGSTPVSVTVTDQNGARATCNFNVVVNFVAPVQPPTITQGTCNDVIISSSQSSTSVRYSVQATGGTGFLTYNYSPPSGSTFNTGTTPVRVTVTDLTGASDTCNFNVVVNFVAPVQPLTITQGTCNDVITSSSQPSTSVMYSVQATGGTGFLTYNYSPQSGSTFNSGSTPVSVTVTDQNGARATCNFNVVVNFVQPLTITQGTCDDVIISSSRSSTPVMYSVQATGGTGFLTYNYSPQSGSAFNIGSTPVSVTVTDQSRAIDTCNFNVVVNFVQPVQPLALNCPQDRNVNTAPGGTSTVVSYVTPQPTSGTPPYQQVSCNPQSGSQFGVGQQVVFCNVNDANSFTSCQFNVFVTAVPAVQPLSLNCPQDRTVNTAPGGISTVVSYVTPQPTSGTPPYQQVSCNPRSGSQFGVGQQVVFCRVNDNAFASASCQFNVFVTSVPLPITNPLQMVCPANMNANALAGQSSVSVFYSNPRPIFDTGTAPIQPVLCSPSSGSQFSVGQTAVVCTVTDGASDMASCQFNVNVVGAPVVPLTLNCPGDINTNTAAGQSTQINYIMPQPTQGTPPYQQVTCNPGPGTQLFAGQHPISCSVTDGAFAVASCQFNAVISTVDTTGPMVTCPANVAAVLPVGMQGTIATWSEPVVEQGAVLVSQTHRSGERFPLGSTPVTYMYRDAAGNVESCTFMVAVVEVDTTGPVVTCPEDITRDVALTLQGAPVTFTTPTARDDSGQANLVSFTHSSGNFFGVGNTAVTYTFEDPVGNRRSCTFNIIIRQVDNQPPSMICPNDIQQDVAPSDGGTIVTWSLSASDNAVQPVATQGCTPSSGSFFRAGGTNVECSATDVAGNTAMCSFSIAVIPVDNTNPVIQCPNDLMLSVNPTIQQTQAFWQVPTPQDITDTRIIFRSHNPGDQFAVGTTSVVYIAQDDFNNIGMCTFDIVVTSTVPLDLTCPGNIDRTASLGQTSTVVTYVTPTPPPGAGTPPVGQSMCSPSSGSSFNVGQPTQVTCFVSDSMGSSFCQFMVNVNPQDDNIPPMVTCPPNIMRTLDGNIPGQVVTWPDPQASDNSGSVSLVSSSSTSGAFFPNPSMTPIRYMYEDPSGNQAGCMFSIVIDRVDTQPPMIMNCLMNIRTTVPVGTAGTPVGWNEPTATDDSPGMVIRTSTRFPGSYFLVGTTPVTYTFTDAAGNMETCSFTVTVEEVDSIPPTVICPQPITLQVPLGTVDMVVTWMEPVVSDNSGMVPRLMVQTHMSGDRFRVGTSTVTYSYIDSSANIGTCTFDVTVTEVDALPPDVNCPANIVMPLPATDTQGTRVNWPPVTATDNSGTVTLVAQSHTPGDFFPVDATSRVTYIYQDSSRNFGFCTFEVTVTQRMDSIPPTVNCPADVVSIQPLNTGLVPVSWTLPTMTDNSGQVFLVSNTHSPNDNFPVGNTQVTYTYRDGANNMASCTFSVIVIQVDQEAPTCVSISDTARTIPVGSQTVAVNFQEPQAMDNGGAVTVVSMDRNPGDNFPIGTTSVCYVFEDSSSNRATCCVNVVVVTVDGQQPTITNCPTNQALQTTAGSATTVTFPPAIATDNSGVNPTISYTAPGVIFSQSANTVTASNVGVGITTVTVTATDASNNMATCTFTITATVNTPPTITSCVADQTVNLPSGATQTTHTFQQPTARDDSGIAPTFSYASNPAGISFFVTGNMVLATGIPAGLSTVIATAMDNENNVALCTFTINGNQGPTLTCPPDQQITVQVGQTAVFIPSATATDANDPNPTVTYSTTTPGVLILGGVTTLLVNNIPQANTIIPVTATARDTNNNAAMCTFNLNINADSPPSITCPPDQPFTLQQGATSVTFPRPTATDDNVTPSVTYSTTTPGVTFFDDATNVLVNNIPPNTGLIPVTATARDNTGNTMTCTVNLIINFDQPPTITCPSDQTYTLQQGTTSISFPRPTATDDTIGVTPSITYSTNTQAVTFIDGVSSVVANNIPQNSGTIPVTASAMDNNGNRAACTFNLVINFDMPPSLSWPSSQPYTLQQGTTSVTFPRPTVTDDSGITPSVRYTTSTPGVTFSEIGTTVRASNIPQASGTIPVTATASDNNGNTVTGIINLIINFDSSPSITCPMDQTRTLQQGTTSVTFPRPTASDDSGITPTLLYTTNVQGVTFFDDSTTVLVNNIPSNTGRIPVTVTAVDNSGNIATCTLNLNVNFDGAPSITCPSDQPYTLQQGTTQVTFPSPTATDDSGIAPTISYTTNTPGVTFLDFTTTVLARNIPQTSGRIAVTANAVDNNGNMATCVTNLQINFDSVPSVTCPSDQTFTLQQGTFTVNFPRPTASDDSGLTPTITYTTNTQGVTFFDGSTMVIASNIPQTSGRIAVTATAVDNNGNMGTCVTNLQINFDGAPSITCPSDQTFTLQQGTTTVNFLRPSASDDSGLTPTITYTTNTQGVTFFDGSTMVLASNIPQTSGTIQVTATAADNNGNVATCITNLQINFDSSPTITCPPDQPYTLQQGTTQVTFPSPTVTDDSGIPPTISYTTNTPGVTFLDFMTTVLARNIPQISGRIAVTATAVDNNGNTATCVTNLQINFDSAPTITCPPDQTFTLQQGTTQVTFPKPTASDDSFVTPTLSYTTSTSGVTFLESPTSILASNVPQTSGTIPVTATASDNNGNAATCTLNLVINFDSSPSISCSPDQTYTLQQGTTSLTFPRPTASDDSGITPTITYTTNSLGVTFFDDAVTVLVNNIPQVSGTIAVTATAVDDNMNIASCTTNLVIMFDSAPSVICPPDQTYTLQQGTTQVSFPRPTASDDSGIAPTLMYSTTTPRVTFLDSVSTVLATSIPQVSGSIQVEATASDTSGNMASCNFNLGINFDSAPSITCPPDQTFTLQQGTTDLTFPRPTASDDSGIAPTLMYSTTTPGVTFLDSVSTVLATNIPQVSGSIQVETTAVDNNGNMASCNFNLGINFDSAPSITCPTDQTFTLQQGTTSVTFPRPTASDDTGIAPTMSFTTSTPGVVFLDSVNTVLATNIPQFPGTIVVMVTATDNNGNSAICEIRLTINFDSSPSITCPSDQTRTLQQGTSTVNFPRPTASDDSGLTPTITYTTNTQGVTFFDGSTMVIASNIPLTSGTIPVTATAADNNGNMASCSLNLVISFDSVPSITCSSDQTFTLRQGTTSVTFPRPTASDDSGLTPTITYTTNTQGVTFLESVSTVQATNIPQTDGIIPVTATASDNNGNMATCNVNLVINFDSAPAITCPPDQRYTLQQGTSSVTFPRPTTSDDSGVAPTLSYTTTTPGVTFLDSVATVLVNNIPQSSGTIPVTVTAVDSNGNVAVCALNLVINFDSSPVISCPQGQTFTLQQGTTSVTIPRPTATDDSGVAPSITYSSNTPGVTFFDGATMVIVNNLPQTTGVIPVTAIARDNNGNTAICTVNVVINFDVAPSITCPPDQPFTLQQGTTEVTFPRPMVSDDSGVTPTITYSTNTPGVTFLDSMNTVLSTNIPQTTGTIGVTATARDNAGNMMTCTVNLIINFDSSPSITCPSDQTRTLQQGTTSVTFPRPTASDDSGLTPTITYTTNTPGVTFLDSLSSVLVNNIPQTSGTIPVTAVATDNNGNTAVCTTSLILNFDSAPTLICPPDQTYILQQGTTDITFPSAIATDDSGIAPQMSSTTSTPGVTLLESTSTMLATNIPQTSGSIQVMTSAVDNNGNVATCTLSLITNFDSAPVIRCAGEQTYYLQQGTRSLTFPRPTASDDSGIAPTFSYTTGTPGVTFLDSWASVLANNIPQISGFLPVTASAADNRGNIATCQINLVINFDSAPSITCPPDQPRTLQQGTTQVTLPRPMATDDSGITPTIIYSTNIPGVTFFDGPTTVLANNIPQTNGVIVVTATARDNNGNAAMCTITVMINFDLLPSITCPPNQNYNVQQGTTDVTFPRPTASDDSGIAPTMSFTTSTPGVVFLDSVNTVLATNIPQNSVTIPVTATAIDNNGNMANCIINLIINMDSAPSITCSSVPPMTLQQGTRDVTFPRPTATDDSGLAPTITYTTTTPGVTFLDSSAIVLANNIPQTSGTIPVIATATDNNGNMVSCSIDLVITFDSPPSITCTPTQQFALQQGQSSVTFTRPIVTDDSAIAPTIAFATTTPGVTFLDSTNSVLAMNIPQTSQTILVTALATDNRGNTAMCAINLIVNFDSSPSITCPQDQTITLTQGTRTFTFQRPTATDDSGIPPTLSFTTTTPGVAFLDSASLVLVMNIPQTAGIIPVTTTAVDNNGNSAMCTVNFNVNFPDTGPVVTCPSSQETGSGTTTLTLTPGATATDDSGIAPTLSYTASAAGVTFLNSAGQNQLLIMGLDLTTVGTVVRVTVTATDNVGNTNMCNFRITSTTDTTPPVVLCPNNFSRQTAFQVPSIPVTWLDPVVMDNSNGQTILISQSHTSGGSFNAGSTTTITYRYADASGNEGMCSFVLTVIPGVDTSIPVVTAGTCPPDVTQVIDIDSAPSAVNWIPPSATDNSGQVPTRTSNRQPGSSFQLGNVDVTYTFCDATNNCNTMCVFSIFLQEEAPVTRNCPNGETLIVPATLGGGTSAQVNYGEITSTGIFVTPADQSHQLTGGVFPLGTSTTRFNYCNNENVCNLCTFTIIVQPANTPRDTTPPTILNRPNDIFDVGSPTTTTSFVSWVAPTATDASGVASQSNNVNYETQQTLTYGTARMVMYSFTDAQGNTASHSFIISASSPTGPTIINCPTSPVTATGAVDTPITWNVPASNGNLVSQTGGVPSGSFPVGSTLVTYVYDLGGQRSVCAFLVTVSRP